MNTTIKTLSANEAFHIITYAAVRQGAPFIYITVPEAGVGMAIAGQTCLEIINDPDMPDVLANIAHTMVVVFDVPDDGITPDELRDALGMFVGPLNMEHLGDSYDVACYTTSVANAGLKLHSFPDAVVTAPAKESLGMVNAVAVEGGTKHTIH